MKRKAIIFALISIINFLLGCSANSLIVTSPSSAKLTLNNSPIENNTITYGRWIGNSYDVQASAPGFIPQKLKLSPHLGSRSTAISVFCLATLVGIPFLPIVFWNGELDDRIYISLEADNTK